MGMRALTASVPALHFKQTNLLIWFSSGPDWALCLFVRKIFRHVVALRHEAHEQQAQTVLRNIVGPDSASTRNASGLVGKTLSGVRFCQLPGSYPV